LGVEGKICDVMNVSPKATCSMCVVGGRRRRGGDRKSEWWRERKGFLVVIVGSMCSGLESAELKEDDEDVEKESVVKVKCSDTYVDSSMCGVMFGEQWKM